MRLEGCEYLVKPILPCVRDEQPALDQDPTGERSKLGDLGQEFLSVRDVGQHKADGVRLDPGDLFKLLEGAVVKPDAVALFGKHASLLGVQPLPFSLGSSEALLDAPGCPPILIQLLLEDSTLHFWLRIRKY